MWKIIATNKLAAETIEKYKIATELEEGLTRRKIATELFFAYSN
jgi:hypothetical protein